MNQKIFLPYSESLLQPGQQPPGELVPYQLAYQCVRLLDGTYEFTTEGSSAQDCGRGVFASGDAGDLVKVELHKPQGLLSRGNMGHAA